MKTQKLLTKTILQKPHTYLNIKESNKDFVQIHRRRIRQADTDRSDSVSRSKKSLNATKYSDV